MEPQEFRFPVARAVLEAALVVAGGLLAATAGSVALRGPLDGRVAAPAALVGSAAGLWLLGFFRWRSRIVLSSEAVERRRSRGRVLTRLPWKDVDEIFLLGPVDVELRGAGTAIRLGSPYALPERVRELCSARLGGLRDRLRERALRDGELGFRMPGGRWTAHVSYLVAILVLTGVTGLGVSQLFRMHRVGFPVILVFFGGGWLWRLRRRASHLGTVVTLYRDGIRVRRLDAMDTVAWSEVAATQWDRRGGLELVLRSGRRISVPARLGNLSLLEEFIEEGREAALPPGGGRPG